MPWHFFQVFQSSVATFETDSRSANHDYMMNRMPVIHGSKPLYLNLSKYREPMFGKRELYLAFYNYRQPFHARPSKGEGIE
jgi:hypothetical protein